MRHSDDREPDTRMVYVKIRNLIVTKIRSTLCGNRREPMTEEKTKEPKTKEGISSCYYRNDANVNEVHV